MNDETVYQLCKQAVSQVILNGCVAQFTIWINMKYFYLSF
jgi:hypothetical protein